MHKQSLTVLWITLVAAMIWFASATADELPPMPEGPPCDSWTCIKACHNPGQPCTGCSCGSIIVVPTPEPFTDFSGTLHTSVGTWTILAFDELGELAYTTEVRKVDENRSDLQFQFSSTVLIHHMALIASESSMASEHDVAATNVEVLELRRDGQSLLSWGSVKALYSAD